VSSRWIATDVLTPGQRFEVLDLINRTEVALEREALDETRRRGVVHGWPGEHYLLLEDGHLVQYAHGTAGDVTSVEMVGGGLDEDLLSLVLERHAVVDWWRRDSCERPHNAVRTLQLLARTLTDVGAPPPPHGTLRTFEPGQDNASWLELNNAAFAHHPEQGAWSEPDLEARLREPWFDPSGFLVLDIDGALAASCWTKVHELYRERFGEIYVLTVSPSHQGRGLGRVMLAAGLYALRRKGVTRVELFVDADNAPALALYQSMGFTLLREDQLLRFRRD
jgi:mycothiol synthase